MNGYFFIKMANMLHRICPTIIKREGRLVKSSRKACTLNPPCERRFSNLVQRFTLHSWPCFQGPCAMDSCSYAYDYCIPLRLRKFHWVGFWIVTCTWHLLHPQKKTQTQVVIAFAMHDVISSSIRQSHVACLFHSLHGRHDFSHATDSY